MKPLIRFYGTKDCAWCKELKKEFPKIEYFDLIDYPENWRELGIPQAMACYHGGGELPIIGIDSKYFSRGEGIQRVRDLHR